MEGFLSALSAIVALIAVAVSYHAVRMSSRADLENRLFTARTEAYGPVVEAIIELRDYARRSNSNSFSHEQPGSVPVLEDGRWLTLLSRVELFATEQVRASFEVLPGHVSAFRLGLLDVAQLTDQSASPDERREAQNFLKKQRSDLESLCETVLAAIRAEVAG